MNLLAASDVFSKAAGHDHITSPNVDNVASNKRYLRSFQMDDLDDDKMAEERGGNIFTNIANAVDDHFNPKTVEQLASRAAKEKAREVTEEFYKNLLNSASFRQKRLAGWKADGVDKAQAMKYLEYDNKLEKKYVDIIEELFK
ncbi:hypothetical protein PHMEG_00022751 [Phytophthora megakarya]|uniref:RxLR effector protein n=1 Tax=Phytophthora megakarya TaxID=4795 RepID=A0A225VHY7_9STRA|nr:hypothetical protein PHMEG_00022751 [Phytophthora megakarya]